MCLNNKIFNVFHFIQGKLFVKHKFVVSISPFVSLKSFIHHCPFYLMSSVQRHPPQGSIYLNQAQPGPLSDPHIAIAKTAGSLMYEQCDRFKWSRLRLETQERWETLAIMKMYDVSPSVLL